MICVPHRGRGDRDDAVFLLFTVEFPPPLCPGGRGNTGTFTPTKVMHCMRIKKKDKRQKTQEKRRKKKIIIFYRGRVYKRNLFSTKGFPAAARHVYRVPRDRRVIIRLTEFYRVFSAFVLLERPSE